MAARRVSFRSAASSPSKSCLLQGVRFPQVRGEAHAFSFIIGRSQRLAACIPRHAVPSRTPGSPGTFRLRSTPCAVEHFLPRFRWPPPVRLPWVKVSPPDRYRAALHTHQVPALPQSIRPPAPRAFSARMSMRATGPPARALPAVLPRWDAQARRARPIR